MLILILINVHYLQIVVFSPPPTKFIIPPLTIISDFLIPPLTVTLFEKPWTIFKWGGSTLIKCFINTSKYATL